MVSSLIGLIRSAPKRELALPQFFAHDPYKSPGFDHRLHGFIMTDSYRGLGLSFVRDLDFS